MRTSSGERKRRPTHPGAVLREDVLPELGLSQRELAQRIGVSRQTISSIVRERSPVTTDLAHRLARFLGTSPEVWVALQRDVDLWDALQKNREAYEGILPVAGPGANSPVG